MRDGGASAYVVGAPFAVAWEEGFTERGIGCEGVPESYRHFLLRAHIE
jgi:hypothetical protein